MRSSRCLDLSRRVGRGDIWRRQWELLENWVYNKPNGCSATGALAPGPDHQQHQQKHELPTRDLCCKHIILVLQNGILTKRTIRLSHTLGLCL
jgi:hypothetical protein